MNPRLNDPRDSANKPKSSWGWRVLNIISQGFTRSFRKLWSVVSSLFFRSSSQETQQSAHESKSESPLPVSETTVTNHIIKSSHSSPVRSFQKDFQSPTPAEAHNEAIVRLSAETESKSAYALYLLHNNSPALLEQVKQRDGNAVLLYPGSTNTSSSGSGPREYKACFIQNGEVQYLPSPTTQSRQLREISIGKRIISIPHPNAANLTNAALARAGIVVAPILIAPKEALLPPMDNRSLVCYATSSFFAHTSMTKYVNLNQIAVETLFMHISNGEKSQVEKMLDANPNLALLQWNSRRTVIQNKGGQRIYVQGKTGYEFAVGEEDTEIAALFKAAIIKAKGKVEGEKIANELFYKQRPPDWEEEEAKRYAPTFAQVRKLAEAIRDGAADITSSGEPDNIVTVEEKSTTGYNLTLLPEEKFRQDAVIQPTLVMTREGKYKLWGYKKENKKWELTPLDNFTLPLEWKDQEKITISANTDIFKILNTGHTQSVAGELAAYRKSLNDRRNEVVTTGRHYNLNLPQELLQIYDDHYVDYFGGRWNDPRAMLFWQQGIGGEQRGMTASMAQVYGDGLFNTTQKLQDGKPQGRALKFEKYDFTSQSWRLADLYPLREDSDLGFDFALDVGDAGAGRGVTGADLGDGVFGRAVFVAYLSQKKAGLQKLTQHHDHQEHKTPSPRSF